jgi:hypothetical protein
MSEQAVNVAVTAALRAIVGNNAVFLDIVPQNAPRKCARYMVVADDPNTDICGADTDAYTYRVQVDVWDETPDLAVATRAAALTAMLSIATFGVGAVTHIGRNPVPYDEEVREARRSDDFYVHISST